MTPRGISTRQLIAQEARLSPTTVSLVLNGRADSVGIRPQTQQRIWEIARRLNYTPNPLAVGLKGGRTATIGLLWSMGGPHATGMISREIARRTQERGYLSHVADHMDDPVLTPKLLSDFARRRVDGIVLQCSGRNLQTPETVELLRAFPAAVIVGGMPPGRAVASIDHIHHDRLSAFVQIADHFADNGKKTPALLGPAHASSGKANVLFEQARRRGMTVRSDALLDTGRTEEAALARQCHSFLERRFADQSFPFDAVACTNDEYAMVLIDYLRRRGIGVPKDVAVVGFNDNPADPYCWPPLASVERNDTEVVTVIEELIFNRLEHSDLAPQRRYIPMRFVWRESAGGGLGPHSPGVESSRATPA